MSPYYHLPHRRQLPLHRPHFSIWCSVVSSISCSRFGYITLVQLICTYIHCFGRILSSPMRGIPGRTAAYNFISCKLDGTMLSSLGREMRRSGTMTESFFPSPFCWVPPVWLSQQIGWRLQLRNRDQPRRKGDVPSSWICRGTFSSGHLGVLSPGQPRRSDQPPAVLWQFGPIFPNKLERGAVEPLLLPRKIQPLRGSYKSQTMLEGRRSKICLSASMPTLAVLISLVCDFRVYACTLHNCTCDLCMAIAFSSSQITMVIGRLQCYDLIRTKHADECTLQESSMHNT